jgi:amino-acid N-acetyltransferase
MNGNLVIRSAAADDIDRIFELLEIYAAQKVVLTRSKEDIAFYIGNFTVAECDGRVCGCVAVRDFGNDLLEIRSLVVAPGLQNKGVGKAMIKAVIGKLKAHKGYWRLFALTMRPDFFRSLAFREVPKSLFPEKIWSDCSKCAKRSRCDETAVLLESAEA